MRIIEIANLERRELKHGTIIMDERRQRVTRSSTSVASRKRRSLPGKEVDHGSALQGGTESSKASRST